jgi:hypothetical protein
VVDERVLMPARRSGGVREDADGYPPIVTQDQDSPPDRDGLTDAQVWEWTGERWEIREIAPFEEPNAGGSPAPVDEP